MKTKGSLSGWGLPRLQTWNKIATWDTALKTGQYHSPGWTGSYGPILHQIPPKNPQHPHNTITIQQPTDRSTPQNPGTANRAKPHVALLLKSPFFCLVIHNIIVQLCDVDVDAPTYGLILKLFINWTQKYCHKIIARQKKLIKKKVQLIPMALCGAVTATPVEKSVWMWSWTRSGGVYSVT